MAIQKALFAGSFDPFTKGHADVVKRGLALFDCVIIAIGINEQKMPMFTAEERVAQLKHYYRNEPRVEVVAYQGLTVELAHKMGATVLLRGVRSALDFEYERSLADINKELTPLDTVLLFTNPSYAHISSSAIRELLHNHYDVSQLLPEGFELSPSHVE